MKQRTEYISENRILVTHKKLYDLHIANILITLLKRNNLTVAVERQNLKYRQTTLLWKCTTDAQLHIEQEAQLLLGWPTVLTHNLNPNPKPITN